MNFSRLAEWLKSIGGVATALSAAGAAICVIYSAVEGQLTPVAELIGLSKGPAQLLGRAVSLLLLLPIFILVVRSYRRFAVASRLELPDRFTLSASSPESLIGRTEDLVRLQDSVVKNRLVLLDGESGCGKSALIAAGLVPRLLAGNAFIPLHIRDWGEDWIRGPLASATGALLEALKPEQRTALAWNHAPDLAADTATLAAELSRRLTEVFARLGCRPLLIADQFDDYQARHREKFLDDDGNWLKPEALIETNPFWALARFKLMASELHMLVVTRADTASGLSCVRFLDSVRTADRHLDRVDLEHLRPLLERIAPADASPAVVSHPDEGWQELRERIEGDLRLQRAILMQQVRTVLLGLRQLPMLTVGAYRRAGELRGTEALVVARAIRRAAEAAGDGDGMQTIARRLLGALVLPAGPEQSAKAQRATFAELSQLAGSDEVARKMLQALQSEEVVRPALGAGSDAAWQLDHDYLAHAVLSEARQADRWSTALHEGLERFRHGRNSWRRQWATLLPIAVQARLGWEWLRGNLRYGEAARYAAVSLTKPALALLLFAAAATATYWWSEDRLLTARASKIYDRFGGTSEAEAVLIAWRAPEPVRERLYKLVLEDDGRLQRATRSAWPYAHGGVEPIRLIESARTLHDSLERENEGRELGLAEEYLGVVSRLTDPAAKRQAADTILASIVRAESRGMYSAAKHTYAKAVAKLDPPAALRLAIAGLRGEMESKSTSEEILEVYGPILAKYADQATRRLETANALERLESEMNRPAWAQFSRSYATIVTQLGEPADINRAATLLLKRLLHEPKSTSIGEWSSAYVKVIDKLADSNHIRSAAIALRERLSRESDIDAEAYLAEAYAAVAAKLTDHLLIQQAATLLSAQSTHQADRTFHASTVAQAHATIVAKLGDATVVQQAVEMLRERLGRQTSNMSDGGLLPAYVTVSSKLNTPSAIQKECSTLREQLELQSNFIGSSNLSRAFASLATRLTDQTIIRQHADSLAARLARETDPYLALNFARAYAAVSANFVNQSDIEQAAAILKKRVESSDPRAFYAPPLAQAYAAVAMKLTDPVELRRASFLLHLRLLRQSDRQSVPTSVKAYAAVATAALKDGLRRNDKATVAVQAQLLVVMAGHPFLSDASDLLEPLRAVSAQDFGSDVGAAVRWWTTEYRADPAALRPVPPSSW